MSDWLRVVRGNRSRHLFCYFAGAMGAVIFVNGLTARQYLDASAGLALTVWASFLMQG